MCISVSGQKVPSPQTHRHTNLCISLHTDRAQRKSSHSRPCDQQSQGSSFLCGKQASWPLALLRREELPVWVGVGFFFFNISFFIRVSVQFSSVTQSCPTLCEPMDCSTPGLPIHHQLPEFTQTHVHWVGDAIQQSHLLSSLSPPAFNLPQHQGLFKWVSSSHQVAKVLEFQLQHQSFQWISRTYFLSDWLVCPSCSPRNSQESSPTQYSGFTK